MHLHYSLCVAIAMAPSFATEALAAQRVGPTPEPAAAGEFTTNADETRQARGARLYTQGTTAYSEGRYKEAIVALTAAYDVLSEPLLLYNIALCHNRLGNFTAAIGHYQRYRALVPESEWPEIDRRIAALEIKQADAARPPPPLLGTPEPKPEEPAHTVEDSGRPATASDRNNVRIFTPAAAVLTTLTIVGAGVGTGLGITALRQKSDAQGGCGKSDMGLTVCTAASEDARNKSRIFGIGADASFAVAGVSAIALIAVLAVRASKRKRSRAHALRIAPGRGGASLRVSF